MPYWIALIQALLGFILSIMFTYIAFKNRSRKQIVLGAVMAIGCGVLLSIFIYSIVDHDDFALFKNTLILVEINNVKLYF